MATTASQLPVPGRISWKRILIWGAVALVSSTIINVIIFFIALATGALSATFVVPSLGSPITIGSVIAATIIGVLAGIIVFAILNRWSKHPQRLFSIIATAFLILSLFSPATIPGASINMIIALIAMHIVAGVVTIFSLTTLAHRL